MVGDESGGIEASGDRPVDVMPSEAILGSKGLIGTYDSPRCMNHGSIKNDRVAPNTYFAQVTPQDSAVKDGDLLKREMVDVKERTQHQSHACCSMLALA